MARSSGFALGDKVRVVADYFLLAIRGRVGTISRPPSSFDGNTQIDGVLRVDNGDPVFWIEFDEPTSGELEVGEIDGAEVSANDLRREPQHG